MLLPPALGSSPHPPVSVYGTGWYHTIAAFLDSPFTGFATIIRYGEMGWFRILWLKYIRIDNQRLRLVLQND